MADDNDKSPLTRRRVLGGMATIGVAGAVGAGAWAGYSDTETTNITAQAGTLDLAVAKINEGGSTGQKHNGNTVNITVNDLAPGETEDTSVRVFNLGSVVAHGMGVRITNIDGGEAKNPESETDTGGDGELDDQLQILAYHQNGSQTNIFGSRSQYNPETYVDLKSAANQGEVQFGGFDLPHPKGDENNYDNLQMEVRFPDLDPSKNNKAMGDTVSFDVEITLYQNNPTSGGGGSGGGGSSTTSGGK